ncbi:ParB N-terminal domain-containing protein (plasmid) [Thioclava sp. 'Guangxiensis']|uniref:ParB/RepB/Spo0J family partition protein n=1 Tax=Thioclava sp. 'Guangxiensis' TaxID=3149044 RepID=UPI0032C49508
MAKRKRLTPANPGFLQSAPEEGVTPETASPPSATGAGPAAPEMPKDLETKAMFPMGVARTVTHRPPIASVAAETADRAALEDMAAMIADLRASGRMVEALPLDQVEAGHLVRDRLAAEGEEMEALVASLRIRGQQVPIEVLDRGPQERPRYGLISGWRRLAALRQLAGDGHGTGTVLAVIRRPETSAEAYVAMVEENEIRADISFYERARIVVKALEEGVFETPKDALNALFGNVARAKRSKIKSFMAIVTALDGVLRFPAAISERAGLDLVKRLEADPDLGQRLRARLAASPAPDAGAEARALAALPPPSDPEPSEIARPAALVPRPDYRLSLDEDAQEIRIAGPDVDAAFMADLKRWLARR